MLFRKNKMHRSRSARPVLEGMESRQLLSTIPPMTVGSSGWASETVPVLLGGYFTLNFDMSDPKTQSPGGVWDEVFVEGTANTVTGPATIEVLHDIGLDGTGSYSFLSDWPLASPQDVTLSIYASPGTTVTNVQISFPGSAPTNPPPTYIPPTYTSTFTDPGHTGYAVQPTGTAWTYSGLSGVTDTSAWPFFLPGRPPATPWPLSGQTTPTLQVGFIQGESSKFGVSSISQQVAFNTAGSYKLSVQAIGTPASIGTDPINILVDGTEVGTINPTTSWATYTTSVFTVTQGVHTIAFVSGNTQFSLGTTCLTNVSIQQDAAPVTATISPTPDPMFTVNQVTDIFRFTVPVSGNYEVQLQTKQPTGPSGPNEIYVDLGGPPAQGSILSNPVGLGSWLIKNYQPTFVPWASDPVSLQAGLTYRLDLWGNSDIPNLVVSNLQVVKVS